MARACFCPVARIGSEVWSMCAARLQRPPTHLGQQLGEWEGSLHAQPQAPELETGALGPGSYCLGSSAPPVTPPPGPGP